MVAFKRENNCNGNQIINLDDIMQHVGNKDGNILSLIKISLRLLLWMKVFWSGFAGGFVKGFGLFSDIFKQFCEKYFPGKNIYMIPTTTLYPNPCTLTPALSPLNKSISTEVFPSSFVYSLEAFLPLRLKRILTWSVMRWWKYKCT